MRRFGLCAWVATACFLVMGMAGCERSSEARASDGAGPRPIRKVLFITSVTDKYDESRSRMVNLLEGMGLPFDVIQHDEITDTDLNNYQLVIMAGSAMREPKFDEVSEQQVIEAIRRGVNCLWVGSGIWGTFRTTNLPETFGLRFIAPGVSEDLGIAQGRFTNLLGETNRLKVHKEMVYKVQAVAADVEGWYLDADGKKLDIPFITRYQAGGRSGVTVYVSLALLNFWKTTQGHSTYARPEVLYKYVRRLTHEGTVGMHSTLGAKEATFILRLEDYTPGGKEFGHARRTWLIRMERLLEVARQHNLPINIAIIPRYAHPYRKEYHSWSDEDPAIVLLRSQAQRAFDAGGSLIVHGYDHQNGKRADDLSGDDWEMWDEDAKAYLPAEQQQEITDRAFAEVAEKWRVTPTIWETPHYGCNEATFRAAYASGFRYTTESDTKIFPNRDGYLGRLQGLMLNLPETGFDYPDEPDGIKAAALVKQRHVLPRLARLNALFLFFYHNDSVQQRTAFENLLTTASRYDLWKPSMAQYAAFWESRAEVRIDSRIDGMNARIVADVSGAFEGLALSVRLPDGMAPKAVTIDGKATEAPVRRLDGLWYVCPVLGEAQRTQVVITYQADPDRSRQN